MIYSNNNYILENTIKDNLGVLSTLSYNYKYVPKKFYQEKIKLNKLNNLKKPIYLYLDLLEGERIMVRDSHRWDLGHPNAYRLVNSKKFKKVLSSKKLPKHKFYNAEIEADGKIHKYYVLHFIHDYLQEIDYKKSQFSVISLMENDRILSVCKEGEIKNAKHFQKKNKILINDMQFLQIKKLCFLPEINYDLWGLHGQIILSEKAKNDIEKAGITGVYMPNIKDVEMFKDLEVV